MRVMAEPFLNLMRHVMASAQKEELGNTTGDRLRVVICTASALKFDICCEIMLQILLAFAFPFSEVQRQKLEHILVVV